MSVVSLWMWNCSGLIGASFIQSPSLMCVVDLSWFDSIWFDGIKWILNTVSSGKWEIILLASSECSFCRLNTTLIAHSRDFCSHVIALVELKAYESNRIVGLCIQCANHRLDAPPNTLSLWFCTCAELTLNESGKRPPQFQLYCLSSGFRFHDHICCWWQCAAKTFLKSSRAFIPAQV